MAISFGRNGKLSKQRAICFIGSKIPAELSADITDKNKKALTGPSAKWQKILSIQSEGKCFVRVPEFSGSGNRREHFRLVGAEIWALLKSANITELYITEGKEEDNLMLAEGLAHKNYRFEIYKDKPAAFELKSLDFHTNAVSAEELMKLEAKIKAIYFARDLVNEPANILTALELSKRIAAAGKKSGFKVEVLKKSKITSLKFGGLLAVNKGSVDEPTFSILTYKPSDAVNTKPIVLVGKGIVYDTGGLSLKPTANSMDIMKCDMGGAAAVAGAIYACALAKLPVHIVGLIPATDNRPGPNAYSPGDVITMHSGLKVEVMNTDAEGRLVLADALSYAKKYNPELAIDLATLTGSSMRALGYYAGATMGTASPKVKKELLKGADLGHERLVEFPLWEDYATDLESDIADTRNLGPSPLADVIIAGKFLEKFVDYPWMHIDIAGPAFLPSPRGYLPKGGTGFGVGLLFEFLKQYKE